MEEDNKVEDIRPLKHNKTGPTGQVFFLNNFDNKQVSNQSNAIQYSNLNRFTFLKKTAFYK